jgi:hypothetical protein
MIHFLQNLSIGFLRKTKRWSIPSWIRSSPKPNCKVSFKRKIIMKEVTLKVPDKKFRFFMELFKQLGLEVSSQEMEIPEAHKAIVRERIQKSQQEPVRLLDWDQEQDNFKLG